MIFRLFSLTCSLFDFYLFYLGDYITLSVARPKRDYLSSVRCPFSSSGSFYRFP
jgi:hypothetical protein